MDPTADVRFTRMYEAYYPDVLAYCARRVDRTDAEDVANEVFTVLWRKIDTVESDTTAAWLYGVAYRTIANRWRGARPVAGSYASVSVASAIIDRR